MLRLRALLPLLLIGAAACATSPTGRRQVILLPAGQMSQMGVTAFEQMKAEQTVEDDPATNAYVRCVALALTKEVRKGAPPNWEVVVFRDPTANAFALPGGKIGVHTGLLDVAKTPAQLAAVVGHEIGHVLARHGNERVSQSVLAQGGVASAGAIFSDPEKAKLAMGALGMGAQFGMLSYSRDHETEADKMGQQIAARAGFDPAGAIQLWQNMAAAGGGGPPEFLSTHPSHTTRINDLRAWLPETNQLFGAAKTAGRNPACAPPARATRTMKAAPGQ